jgi:hypothetical protein
MSRSSRPLVAVGIRRLELLCRGLQKAVECPPAALVRLKQCDVRKHVSLIVIVDQDLPVCPETELLRRSRQICATADRNGRAEHVLDARPDRAIKGEHVIALHGTSPRRGREDAVAEI